MTGSWLRGWTRIVLLGTVVAGAAACGEVKPQGVRGYTKPPLEKPGPFITPEPESEMSKLGAKPNLPPEVVLEFSDSVLVQRPVERRARR
jgi:hypothetical protein